MEHFRFAAPHLFWHRVTLLLIVICFVLPLQAASPTVFRAETSVMGESAIVDKETGRIVWEGGARNTLSTSLGPRLRKVVGRHFRATCLSVVLWTATIEQIVEQCGWIRYFQPNAEQHTYWTSVLRSFTQTILFSLPRIPKVIVVVAVSLYLLECFQCSTRKYISNAVEDVESLISDLRQVDPIIEWKVRSFHYDNPLRKVWSSAFDASFRRWGRKKNEGAVDTAIKQPKTKISDKQRLYNAISSTSPSLFQWKYVTKVSQQRYNFQSCVDQTIAGMWKRAAAPTPLFRKVLLTKTMLLRDAKARADYVAQQREFLRTAHTDDSSEFSTTVKLPGYQARLLQGGQRWRLMSLFWLTSLAGMTVPFRHWFARRCDEVRVTVVKETGASSRGYTASTEQYTGQETIRSALRYWNVSPEKSDNQDGS